MRPRLGNCGVLCVQIMCVWCVRTGCEQVLGDGWASKVAFWGVLFAAFATVKVATP